MPEAAPDVIGHLVMRGGRTVAELAEASIWPVGQVADAVKWLRSMGFLEHNRHKEPDGRLIETYAIRVPRRAV